MGQKLTALFDQAKEKGGLTASIRLATLSRMSSIDAKKLPDDTDTVSLVAKNLKIVLDELQTTEAPQTESVSDQKSTVAKLRNFMRIFADVLSTQEAYQEDVKKSATHITPALTEAVNVERASVWLYNQDKSAIICTDLYEKSAEKHSSGVELKKTDFPRYFDSIATSRTLAAEDAHTHPGTAEFSASYLTPLGINSMLDVPIFANGNMVGVVCHEHTGPQRKWSTDEENFAYIMGNLVGLSIEKTAGK